MRLLLPLLALLLLLLLLLLLPLLLRLLLQLLLRLLLLQLPLLLLLLRGRRLLVLHAAAEQSESSPALLSPQIQVLTVVSGFTGAFSEEEPKDKI